MADPFDALRAPLTPVDPDPTFAARLRSRLERALTLPEGVTVSLTLASPPATPGAPALSAAVTPYLAVAGAERALDWYAEAFGARRRGEPIVMPDGRIGHAELEIAGGLLMLSEEHPEIGVTAPVPGQGVAVTIHLQVDDVDAVIGRAVEAGAALDRPAADYEYGRNGVIRDPFGHRWLISGPSVPSSAPAAGRHGDIAPRHGDIAPRRGDAAPRRGDVGYASLWLPDADRATAFYAAVLGWRYAPTDGPGSRQVEGQSLHHGLFGGQAHPTLYLCFAVDHVDAAAERVRAAGGTAGAPEDTSHGPHSDCVDNQGVPFSMFEPPAGPSRGRREPGRTRQGDLAYVTMEVVDSGRARAFYGSVLGWRFTPGRVEDGWQVADVAPMVGLSGGHPVATTVPMYQVDDIVAAVARVRAAGGSATEPEHQPYGITATCADDQGTRFYLGQL